MSVVISTAEQTREEVQTITSPILARTTQLQVTNAASYAVADGLLARLREARKTIEIKLSSILDPINEARKAALELKHSLDDPLETAETSLRAQMKTYKLSEHRQALEAERKAREESARLSREAEEKRQKELAAKSAPMRARLANQRIELEQKAAEVASVPIPTPVKVANSSTRTVKCWRVTDFSALVKAAADPASQVPEDALALNTVAINAYFRDHQEEVGKWPGVELYDDIRIVGSR